MSQVPIPSSKQLQSHRVGEALRGGSQGLLLTKARTARAGPFSVPGRRDPPSCQTADLCSEWKRPSAPGPAETRDRHSQAPPQLGNISGSVRICRDEKGWCVAKDGAALKIRAFEEQILPVLPLLYRAALRLTGEVTEAEDLVQDTCLRAFQSLDQLRHPQAAKAWVFSILRSVFLRRTAREAPPTALVSLDDLDGSRLMPADGLRALHDLAASRPGVSPEIRQAVLRLPAVYREAIILAHVAGFSYREMAQILEVPVGTIMSRLFRARRMLRAELRETLQRREGLKATR
jgi:RNA polymerase sigma-70 factor, ECF subfamily